MDGDKDVVYTMQAVLLFIVCMILLACSPAIVIWMWSTLL